LSNEYKEIWKELPEKAKKELHKTPLQFEFVPFQKPIVAITFALIFFLRFWLPFWSVGLQIEVFNPYTNYAIGWMITPLYCLIFGPLTYKIWNKWKEALIKLRRIFKDEDSYYQFLRKSIETIHDKNFLLFFSIVPFIPLFLYGYPSFTLRVADSTGKIHVISNIFSKVGGIVAIIFEIPLYWFIGQSIWLFFAVVFNTCHLDNFKDEIKIIQDPKERFGMRPLGSTTLVLSLTILAITAPYTFIPLMKWILSIPQRPLEVLVPVGGYFLAFFSIFYPMREISNTMAHIKEQKLREVGEKIDRIEEKLKPLEEGINSSLLESDRIRMKTLERFHRQKVREFRKIKKMKTNPIDITIAVKLLTSAGAPLISILFRYVI